MNKITPEFLDKTVSGYLDRVREIRHHLHTYPEPGYKEFETCRYIRNILKELSLEILPPFLETDTVAFLNRSNEKKNITLRADIDALPIEESSDHPYKSKNKGFMHACGHDGHTAVLLGTAMVLNDFREQLDGSVRFVFQPAEEIYSGASKLVARGCLESPKPDSVFAIHDSSKFETGVIATRQGPITAACARFKVRIIGKGGHGAKPELSIDPILTSIKIIDSFYHIPSRYFSAVDNILVTVCMLHSGTAENVIPDTATFEGSVRYFDLRQERRIKATMERIMKGICFAAGGAKYEFEFMTEYLPCINDQNAVDFSKKTVEKYIGKKFFKSVPKPILGSEDFSFFMQKAPGALLYLGIGTDKPEIHSSKFDFNDDALFNGIKLMSALAIESLGGK